MRLGVLLAMLAAGPALADPPSPQTQRLFRAKCASCHGMDGKAQTEQGKKLAVRDMTTAEYQKGTDASWRAAIADGVKADVKGTKTEVMQGYKASLKPEQIDALVAYIRTLK